MTEIWVPLVGGLFLLLGGGELLVRGAVRVAESLGVSPLVIGLTLVGFGTSMPELVTSVQAALAGSPGIAYGNVVGSNIANILLILGASALLSPIVVSRTALRRDALVMFAVAILFAAVTAVLPLGRATGAVCLAALALYVYAAIRQERRSGTSGALHDKVEALAEADIALRPGADGRLLPAILCALAGLGLVVLGGTFLVDGAVALARSFAISETVIGLTIVAVGTSMPELVTSLIAALRRQADVAFGNIVGSNIYNILGIAGTTAAIAPSPVPREIVSFDNPVMLAATAALLLVAWTGFRISRGEGAMLLAAYAVYIWANWP